MPLLDLRADPVRGVTRQKRKRLLADRPAETRSLPWREGRRPPDYSKTMPVYQMLINVCGAAQTRGTGGERAVFLTASDGRGC